MQKQARRQPERRYLHMQGLSVIHKKRSRVLHKIALSRYLYLFLLPSLIYLIIFHYMPIYGVQIAFKRFMPTKGIWDSPWVGVANFRRFFSSYYFERVLANTIKLSLYNLIAGFPFPVIMALLFNEIRSAKMKKLVQTVSYVPHFISVIVLVGMVNLFFGQTTGLINTVRRNMGLETIGFLNEPKYFASMYVWSGIWQHAGWNAIIYIAALSGIDPELHEAAQIDGASRLKRIWYINLPCILPTVIIMFILDAGKIMSLGFEKIYLMQNTMNISASQVISTFVYESGMLDMDYGFASAVDLFNNVVNIALLLLVNQLARRVSQTSLF